MTAKKSSWDDIPSLDGLSVDWDFKPENPLGKRAHIRMDQGDLHSILEVNSIPVKVVTTNQEANGHLVDLTIAGLAVNLYVALGQDIPVKIGFFLGQQKIISNAIVKHVEKIDGNFKIGMAFANLKTEYEDYIKSLSAAQISKF